MKTFVALVLLMGGTWVIIFQIHNGWRWLGFGLAGAGIALLFHDLFVSKLEWRRARKRQKHPGFDRRNGN